MKNQDHFKKPVLWEVEQDGKTTFYNAAPLLNTMKERHGMIDFEEMSKDVEYVHDTITSGLDCLEGSVMEKICFTLVSLKLCLRDMKPINV